MDVDSRLGSLSRRPTTAASPSRPRSSGSSTSSIATIPTIKEANAMFADTLRTRSSRQRRLTKRGAKAMLARSLSRPS